MWYWTIVRTRIDLDTVPHRTLHPCWHILHKVKMNAVKENPFAVAQQWVEDNKQPGEEYVILKMFFV